MGNTIEKVNIEELYKLCDKLRAEITEVTLRNGGHLASNLGAVELTVALHRVFDLPHDKVIWDVGHQTYAHKFLTGRGKLMQNLRHDGGASGFPSPSESEYDEFITGHSGTSLSLAMGLARARDLEGKGGHIVAVVGDGAFTSGEIYEALNDLGDRPTKLIIVLNDNNMSISRNVGAMSKYFNRLRVNKKFVDLKSGVKKNVGSLPFVGTPLIKALTFAKDKVKAELVGNKFFERFGLKYYGPYDGHDISVMTDAFEQAKSSNVPVLIHLITKKGKGMIEAEKAPNAYHGVSPENEKKIPSMSACSGEALISLAQKRDIAVITAAMSDGLCLNGFAKRYPERFFDVAIAEQHAVSLAAGLSKSGIKPYFAVYSTFLQRAFDQVLHDVALNSLPVTFLIDRAGAVGADGATHQGIFDLSYLSLIPNMAIASPKDGEELKALIEFSATYDAPLAIRYAKSYETEFSVHSPVELGKWERLIETDSPVTVLAVGRMTELAVGLRGASIVNARFVRPLDVQLLDSLEGHTIITIEDNVLHGGFGEAVRNYLYGKNKVITFGHPNEFCDVRDIEATMKKSGLTRENIQKTVDMELLSLENRKKL